MIAKHLEGLANYLLLLAGVPTQIPHEAEGNEEPASSGLAEQRTLQPVPVKNFLHYL
jgi:hypothetical protein